MDTSKRIAVLTGATGGLGHAFLKELLKSDFDEIWAVGRNEKRLEELAEEFGTGIIPLSMDLTKSEDIELFAKYSKNKTRKLMF